MASKKRKEDDETGLDKKRRKSGAAANGSELHGAAVASGQLPVVFEGEKECGELLICGGMNWDLTGRKQLPKTAKGAGGRNLWSAHRVASLKGVPVRTIASGCMACHSIVITADGNIYSWGRNENAQLGQGDTVRRDVPTIIDGLAGLKIVRVACGKAHTLFMTDHGAVYAAGSNVNAQLGLGNQSPNVPTPTKIAYKGPPVCRIAAGGEFSVIGDVVGNLYTFGNPEYGQLGHNTDGKYFVTNSKLGFSCETRPRRVMVFIEKTRDGVVSAVTDVEVKDVVCGQNHVVVLDQKDRIFTWGFGGYGRLGHDENKDELVPRLLKFFDGPNRGAAMIAAGSTCSIAVNKLGAVYLWGQTKNTGDATMYPKPIHDLSGWTVRSIGCCYKSIVLAADSSIISWGSFPTYGELGYGANSVKTSTTPQEVRPLDGVHIHRVATGWGHTLLLARNDTEEEKAKLEDLPEYVP